MNSNGLIKLLALLVFIGCASTGLSLSLLAYTFATGELPFGVQPMVAEDEKEEQKEDEKDADPAENKKAGIQAAERYVPELFDRLKKKRKELEEKEQKLAVQEEQKIKAEETAEQIEKRLVKTEQDLRNLIEIITEEKRQNAQSTAELLASMEPASAADTLMKMDTTRAAVIFKCLETESSANILGALKQLGAEEGEKKAQDILNRLYSVVDNEEVTTGG